MIPIERTHEFRGRYHVLGGALSPIDGVEPEDLKIAQLYARVEPAPSREVVLATNPTTTGEATALHIAAALHSARPTSGHALASGLPVGGDLEYADEVTLGRASPAGARCERGAAPFRGRSGAVRRRRPPSSVLWSAGFTLGLARARGLRAADVPRARLRRGRGGARPGVRRDTPAAPAQRGRVGAALSPPTT